MNVGTAFFLMTTSLLLAWGWYLLSMEAFQAELAKHAATGEMTLSPRADQSIQFVASGLLSFSLFPVVMAAAAWVGVRQPAAGFVFFLGTTLSTLGVVGAVTLVQTVSKGGQAVDILAMLLPTLVTGTGEWRERAFVAAMQMGAFAAMILVPTLLLWLSAAAGRRLAGPVLARQLT